jgi:hypothetical protein
LVNFVCRVPEFCIIAKQEAKNWEKIAKSLKMPE